MLRFAFCAQSLAKSSRNDAQNFRAFCLNLRASTGFVARYRTRLSCLNLSASSHIDLLASPRANSPEPLCAKSRTLDSPGPFMKYSRRLSDPSAASSNLSKSKPGFKRNLTLKFASAKPARSRPLRFFARFTRAGCGIGFSPHLLHRASFSDDFKLATAQI